MTLYNKMPENKEFMSPVSILTPVENIPRCSTSKICLFGRPDPSLTQRLIAEHLHQDRQRMLQRWGFDILQEKFKSPNKPEAKARRRAHKALLEDKENINLEEDKERKLQKQQVGDPMKEKMDSRDKDTVRRKLSLKMTTDRQRLRKARQSTQVTDFWRCRKFSESSSCSDKEN